MLVRFTKDSQSFKIIIYEDTLSAQTERNRESTKCNMDFGLPKFYLLEADKAIQMQTCANFHGKMKGDSA